MADFRYPIFDAYVTEVKKKVDSAEIAILLNGVSTANFVLANKKSGRVRPLEGSHVVQHHGAFRCFYGLRPRRFVNMADPVAI